MTTLDLATGLWIALISLGAGTYGGLMGVGGGAILVPALHLFFGIPLQEAIPFSLATAVLISGAASFSINRDGSAHFPTVRSLLIGSVPGAVLGLSLGRVLPDWALRDAFEIFLLWAVLDTWKAKPDEQGDAHRWRPTRPHGVVTSIIGVFMGLASGLLGIGGGLVSTPLLRKWLGVPVKSAMANSTLAIVGTTMAGVVAAAFYRQQGGQPLLPWSLLEWGAMPVLAGGYLGGLLHHRVHSRWLLRLFAALLLFVAFKMLTAG